MVAPKKKKARNAEERGGSPKNTADGGTLYEIYSQVVHTSHPLCLTVLFLHFMFTAPVIMHIYVLHE